MDLFFFVLFVFWSVAGLELLVGSFLVPILLREPLPDERLEGGFVRWPRVSVIFAARDEKGKAGPAATTMLLQDYPELEVIAVDDRSADGTGDELRALSDARLRVLRVDELPAGWLGKTHALHRGAAAAEGEWLLFTDADVHFRPSTVRRAVVAARRRGLDHLTLFPELDLPGYLEGVFTNYFASLFNMRFRPYAARFRRRGAYAGIGAFQLVRRDAYRLAGGHERIRLDVADDMMLGRALKASGARSMLMAGNGLVRVRWVQGWSGVLSSLRKNAFRGIEYSFGLLVLSTFGILALDVAPFLGVLFLEGAARAFAGGCVGVLFLLYASAQRFNRLALASFPCHPAAAMLFLYILWRSALDALVEGGVRWRGTFYRLDDLKRGRLC